MTPRGGGGPYQSAALVDSGAGVTFVPNGVPERHGWTSGQGAPSLVNPVGGGSFLADVFPVTLNVLGDNYSIMVHEMNEESALRCVLLGHDILRELEVLLHGPRGELEIEVPHGAPA
ncbi:MAG TPA: hypothetical protein VIK38_12475 [Coriobacteriia bacterium]